MKNKNIKLKAIPKFSTEDEEREFWNTHDTTDYIDWSKAKQTLFPKLKPSTQTISLRLPEDLLSQIKILANKRDMPYQSFLKNILYEHVQEESSKYQ